MHKQNFGRDMDALLAQYHNLRMSVYEKNKYGLEPLIRPSDDSYHKVSTKGPNIRQQELMEYIDEQFVKLVKEYDINGPIDFPGYIAYKLPRRVRHSYLKSVFIEGHRERLGYDEEEVERNIPPSAFSDAEYHDLIASIASDIPMNRLEKVLFHYWLTSNLSDTKIFMELRHKPGGEFEGILRDDFEQTAQSLRERIVKQLGQY